LTSADGQGYYYFLIPSRWLASKLLNCFFQIIHLMFDAVYDWIKRKEFWIAPCAGADRSNKKPD
jgi:hypothetical protein